jgi:multiple sugar transport system ATP-binding protein
MASVVLDHVRKSYGRSEVIKGVSTQVADGELRVVLGPSGCGKSTILRMIAGLEDISDGTIRIGERVVNRLEPKDRDIAMVFQNYALYPHMRVFDNMAYGLRNQGTAKAEIERRVSEVARILGLEDLLARRPRELSGGQRQRVAMGRALVRDPKVFLMDEPLSNLDAKLRVQMRYEVTRIQRELGTTTIYVTHDQVEAMTMGTRVAVMRGGDLQQVDRPETLYEEPANLFVAAFIGSPEMNLLRATLVAGESGPELVVGGQRLPLPATTLDARPELRERQGAELVVGVRPEALSPFDPGRAATAPRLVGEVAAAEMLGADRLVHVELPEAPVFSGELLEDSASSANGARPARDSAVVARFDSLAAHPAPGQRIEVGVALDRAHFFDPESGLRLQPERRRR